MIIVLPNTEDIKEAIKANDGYCPCAAAHTPDTKCMCKEFREMEEGTCHCGRYKKVKQNLTIEEKYDIIYI